MQAASSASNSTTRLAYLNDNSNNYYWFVLNNVQSLYRGVAEHHYPTAARVFNAVVFASFGSFTRSWESTPLR